MQERQADLAWRRSAMFGLGVGQGRSQTSPQTCLERSGAHLLPSRRFALSLPGRVTLGESPRQERWVPQAPLAKEPGESLLRFQETPDVKMKVFPAWLYCGCVCLWDWP